MLHAENGPSDLLNGNYYYRVTNVHLPSSITIFVSLNLEDRLIHVLYLLTFFFALAMFSSFLGKKICLG